MKQIRSRGNQYFTCRSSFKDFIGHIRCLSALMALQALQAYLDVRGMGPTDHVFLYRNRPVCHDLIRDRIKAAGKRVGVKVSPHRLRHTFATQLINVGCRVTTIQRVLGHRRLNSTMVYARVHDRTVAEDYYDAMAKVERSLTLKPEPEDAPRSVWADERAHLVELVRCMAKPELTLDERLGHVASMLSVLEREPLPKPVTAVARKQPPAHACGTLPSR